MLPTYLQNESDILTESDEVKLLKMRNYCVVQDTDEILSGEWFSQILLNEYVRSLAMT